MEQVLPQAHDTINIYFFRHYKKQYNQSRC